LEHSTLLYLAGVLVLGIAAQWLAWRLRFPSILLLLGFGFTLAAVAEPLGWIDPSSVVDDALLLPVVSLSVAVILFEGGLTLRLAELREAGRALLRLITLGALLTWGLTTLAARCFCGLGWPLSLLLGAILVVTGPTVIGPLLRHVRPTRRIGAVLKWEGIVIDPIGAVLAVLVFEGLSAGGVWLGATGALWGLAMTILVGIVVAALTGLVLLVLLRRFLIPDFLHNAVILAAVVASFAVSNVLQEESGLLTVTLLGVIMANQRYVSVRHVAEFKENLQVLLISCLFIVLASRQDPEVLAEVGWGGLLFLTALIVVVRPASVYLSTVGSELNLRERTFLAFLAPRGIVAAAVAAVFSLKLGHESLGALGAPDRRHGGRLRAHGRAARTPLEARRCKRARDSLCRGRSVDARARQGRCRRRTRCAHGRYELRKVGRCADARAAHRGGERPLRTCA
jgi:NhaP-type Na+/H+ or K+/H+ antiporter